jgi:hypothetical protein
VKRYKFQALVTLGPARDGGLAVMHSGQTRRVVVRGYHHPGEYFEIGDSFAFWLGHDLGRGVVTRRLFV